MADCSLESPIKNIVAVKALAPTLPDKRPVFLLLGADQSMIVVKQEEGAANNLPALKFNLKAMKSVSPAAAGKLMQQGELDYIDAFLEMQDIHDKVLMRAPDESVKYLRETRNSGGTLWFKMKKAEGIRNIEAAFNALRNDQDKSGVRAMAKALNSPGGCEMLGKIVAIDLYNHNMDRCIPRTAKDRTNDRRKGRGMAEFNIQGLVRMRVLFNLGNVLFALDQGKLKPVGLDPYQAAGAYRDVGQTIAQLEQAVGGKWAGYYLNDTERDWRKGYAHDIIDDIEDLLGPRTRKMPMGRTKRLDADAPKRVFKGMEEAIVMLRAHLVTQTNKALAPVGLTDRLQRIG